MNVVRTGELQECDGGQLVSGCQQYSPLWWELKKGIPSSSRVQKIITGTAKRSKSISDFKFALAAEAGGELQHDYRNEWMDKASDGEGSARKRYELERGIKLTEVGCVFPNTRMEWLVSPDAVHFDGDRIVGGVEIKRPKLVTMLKIVNYKSKPTPYLAQIYSQMHATGADWWDYVADTQHETARWDLNQFVWRVTKEDEGFRAWVTAFEQAMSTFIPDLNLIRGLVKLPPLDERTIDWTQSPIVDDDPMDIMPRI